MEMGDWLEVVEDMEVEQDEEDREVEKILQKGKETTRKLAMGTYIWILCQTGQTVYSAVHVLTNNIKINVCQTGQTVYTTVLTNDIKINVY